MFTLPDTNMRGILFSAGETSLFCESEVVLQFQNIQGAVVATLCVLVSVGAAFPHATLATEASA